MNETITTVFSSLDFWEYVEYVATAIVFVAAIGEYIAEFPKWPKQRGFAESLGKISTLVLIVGLAGELLGVVRTSQISGRTIADLKLEAARLLSAVGPRHLTDDQKRRFKDKAAWYGGIPIDVFVMPQEDRPTGDEAVGFGKDITDALVGSMDVSSEIGMGCSPWPYVGILVTGPPDMSRDRFAAGDLLELFKNMGFVVTPPYVAASTIPPCKMFSTLTGKPTSTRNYRAKINIIVGKKPTLVLK